MRQEGQLTHQWEDEQVKRQKIKLRYRIADIFGEVLLAGIFLLGLFLEVVVGFIKSVIKFPLRSVCKAKGDHAWVYYGGGFSPFPGPKYPFVCERCGTRSKGDFDSLKKKGFKGTAKIK